MVGGLWGAPARMVRDDVPFEYAQFIHPNIPYKTILIITGYGELI